MLTLGGIVEAGEQRDPVEVLSPVNSAPASSCRITQKRRSTPSPSSWDTCVSSAVAEVGSTGRYPAGGSSTMPPSISMWVDAMARPGQDVADLLAILGEGLRQDLAGGRRARRRCGGAAAAAAGAVADSGGAGFSSSSHERGGPLKQRQGLTERVADPPALLPLPAISASWHWNWSTWARNTFQGRIAVRPAQ